MVIPHTQTYSQEWADGIVAVLFREFGRNMMPGCLLGGVVSLSSVESGKASFVKTQPLDVIKFINLSDLQINSML